VLASAVEDREEDQDPEGRREKIDEEADEPLEVFSWSVMSISPCLYSAMPLSCLIGPRLPGSLFPGRF
jgi:hypothetical protein